MKYLITLKRPVTQGNGNVYILNNVITSFTFNLHVLRRNHAVTVKANIFQNLTNNLYGFF